MDCPGIPGRNRAGSGGRIVTPRILEAGLKLQRRGLTRFLALSKHHRPLATAQAQGGAGNPACAPKGQITSGGRTHSNS